MRKGTYGKTGHNPNYYPYGAYGSSGEFRPSGESTSSHLPLQPRPRALLNGERDYFPIHPTSSPNKFGKWLKNYISPPSMGELLIMVIIGVLLWSLLKYLFF
jgi:hypothetical protein